MDAAAQNGALWVVQWLHANRTEGCTGDALFFASKVGPPSFLGNLIFQETLFFRKPFLGKMKSFLQVKFLFEERKLPFVKEPF